MYVHPSLHSALHDTPHPVHSPSKQASSYVYHSPMEVASLQQQQQQQQQLSSDSFSHGWLRRAQAPSFERLADAGVGYGHPFGSSRSFIDMDPAELFSMRWTATPSDFDFVLPVPESGEPASPVLVSASQIFRGGRLLLPCEPGGCSGAREDGDESAAGRLLDLDLLDMPSAPRSWASSPLFYSAQSTPCTSARSGNGKHGRPRLMLAGRRGGSTSPWKVLLRYLRFLLPLYRKASALRPARNTHRVSPASPGRGSTSSSLEWCHGNADTAVDDAILYCKKSSGQKVLA